MPTQSCEKKRVPEQCIENSRRIVIARPARVVDLFF